MTAVPGIARRIATGTLHAASGRVAGLLLWLLLTPPILGALGPDGFAVWSLTFAFTGYLTALDLGLAQGTLRNVAAARGRGEPGGGGAFATLAILGYLALGALWLGLSLLLGGAILGWLRVPDGIRDDARFALIAGAGVFTCSGLANVTTAALQGCGWFDRANRVSLVVVAVQGLGIVLALRAGWGLPGLITALGLGWAAGFATGTFELGRADTGFRWESPGRSRPRIPEALRFGGPLQLANALSVVHGQVDKLILARYVALAAITPFELGLRVITAVSSVPQMLLLAVVPAAAALQAGSERGRLLELYHRGNRYLLATGAVLFAACLGSADRLYLTWLGPGHPQAALALRGLTLSAAVALACSMGVTVARGVGRTDLEVWLAGCGLAVHLVVSIVLVPIFGLSGALLGLFAGHVVGGAVFLWRLTGVLGWARAGVLLEPLGVPVVAIAVGAAAAALTDRALPAGDGAAAWALLALVGGVGAGAAGAVIVLTRFIRLGEAWRLIRPAP